MVTSMGINFLTMVEQIFRHSWWGDVTIDKEGQIFQGDQNIGKLGVSFENPLLDLQKGGGFVAKDLKLQKSTEPTQFTVMQGYLNQVMYLQ